MEVTGLDVLKLTPPQGGIKGEISLPGSKSYTNRALIMASLAEGRSLLREASLSDDSRILIAALTKLGVDITLDGTTLCVNGKAGRFEPYRGEIDVGPAGTAMRFLTALCALVPGGEIILRGSERMHCRPIADLVSALQGLGADLKYLRAEGCPPLLITGHPQLQGTRVRMNGSASSQFFSAMLLLAPLYRQGLTIEVEGEQVSKSYIDMTLESMRGFGVSIANHGYHRYQIAPQLRYQAGSYTIEGDASGASYFWAMAAISGGKARVQNLRSDSVQGDARFPALLSRMGCRVSSGVEHGAGWIEVEGTGDLKALEADMSSMPDTAQTLAVAATLARGKTRLTGLSTLRRKETDRIAALQQELARVGIKSESSDDSLTIFGGEPHGARIQTYDDHRMAMAFSVLGARVGGMEIEHPAVVNKSFPEFWDKLSELGIGLP